MPAAAHCAVAKEQTAFLGFIQISAYVYGGEFWFMIGTGNGARFPSFFLKCVSQPWTPPYKC